MFRIFHKDIRFFFCYLVFSAIFIIAALEGIVRLFHLAPPLPTTQPFFVKDSYLPFKPLPSSRVTRRAPYNEFVVELSHNSFGFRDVEHPVEKPDGVFRILGIGDSFTYGTGAIFEETYLFRLEDKLNTRGDKHPKIEIIKAGIPRYFPETERLLLEYYGSKFKPDLILVGFLRNDLLDTFYGMEGIHILKNGYLISKSRIGQIDELSVWLYMHSHVFRVVMQIYSKYNEPLRNVKDDEIYKSNGYFEKEWRKIEAEYGNIIDLARQNNSQTVFFNIPMDASWGKPASTYPPKRLAAWAFQKGVPFIDITPAMERASKAETLYWKIDGHCNNAGYKVIADTLFTELTKAGLVP